MTDAGKLLRLHLSTGLSLTLPHQPHRKSFEVGGVKGQVVAVKVAVPFVMNSVRNR
jgi:hypothetical protein